MSIRNKLREWLGIENNFKYYNRQKDLLTLQINGIDRKILIQNSNIDELIRQNKFLNVKLDLLMQGKS
jgi:hypothetical protein